MRKDLVVGGAATGVLMLVAFWLLSTVSLPVPTVLTQVTLIVAVIGVGVMLIGLVLPSPRPKRGRRGSDRERL